MIQYSKDRLSEYDVYDLLEYQKARTMLIDDEEVAKLSLYKNPPIDISRETLEKLFIECEDHPIFKGEIKLLLFKYFNKETFEFDSSNYLKTWNAFQMIFKGEAGKISTALLYYGITWFKDSPSYYNNYDCQDWSLLVQRDSGKYLLELLEDMHEKPYEYLDEIIKSKAKNYFINENFTSIENIKAVEDLYAQVRILVSIDYFSRKVLWKSGGYIAEDIRYNSGTFGDTPFFTKDRLLYNRKRYIDTGHENRIIEMMWYELYDVSKLKMTLEKILNYSDL